MFKPEEQDAFRGFMAKVLEQPKKLAEDVVTKYLNIMSSAIGYRTKPVDAWHQVLEKIISGALLEHSHSVRSAQEQRHAEEERAEALLQSAVDLVLDPNQYLEQISSVWAKDEKGLNLSLESYYALYKRTKEGREFLAFTEESLKRLCLEKVDFPKENYTDLIGRLKSLAIITCETTPTHLSNKTKMRVIRIPKQFCESFTVTEVTHHKEDTINGL